MEDCKVVFGRINGDSFFFIWLWILSLMCLSFFFNCVEVLVCFSMSWFKMIKLLFRVFSEWYERLDKVIVFWWFFWIVGMMVLKCLWIVDINKDKCWFCCVFGFCKVVVEGLYMFL